MNQHVVYWYWCIGVDNGAAGAAAVAPIIWLVVIAEMMVFLPPQTNFSLPYINAIWVNFSVTNHYDFYAQNAKFPHFISLASLDI